MINHRSVSGHRMRCLIGAFALVASSSQAQQFSDVSDSAAPRIDHRGVPVSMDYFSTGQAFGDVDQDGFPDLFLTSSEGANSLLRNRGDGSFELWDIGAALALPDHLSGGALFLDYDNDGWPDLLVLGRGSSYLFRNLQGQGFADVSAITGIGAVDVQAQSAAAGDIDGDGRLDLYIVAWMDIGHGLTQDRLLRQNAEGGFDDWSHLLDLDTRSRPGFAVSMLDLDDDGDLDIFVVNDKLVGNALWRNDGPGCGGWCFTDVAVSSGAFRPVFGMGLAHGDIDHDGDLDLYFSSIGEQVLLRNDSDANGLRFTEISQSSGTAFDAVGWGAEFLDLDLDGRMDLYLCTMTQSNRVFRNVSDGVFTDVSVASGADDAGASIGLAFADFDRDGRLDLIVGNWRDRYRIYRNTTAVAGRTWAGVTVRGGGPINRDAIGTKVFVLDSLGREHRRDVRAGSAIGGGSEIALHFAFGDAVPTFGRVSWPDGSSQPFRVQSNVYQTIDWQPVPDALLSDGFD